MKSTKDHPTLPQSESESTVRAFVQRGYTTALRQALVELSS